MTTGTRMFVNSLARERYPINYIHGIIIVTVIIIIIIIFIIIFISIKIKVIVATK